jgi:hypothetical protein
LRNSQERPGCQLAELGKVLVDIEAVEDIVSQAHTRFGGDWFEEIATRLNQSQPSGRLFRR